MKKNYQLIIFFIILLIFTGCSSKKDVSYSLNKDKTFPIKDSYNYNLSKSVNYDQIYNALQKHYQEWYKVKYKFGGNTRKGIDCSAFVQRTYKDALNIKIPRTTLLQASIGKKVSMEELQIGDLVFFKTGYKVRHVGIYLDGGKFLHASTKRGVTISRLDNNYYSKHFWKIKRVIY